MSLDWLKREVVQHAQAARGSQSPGEPEETHRRLGKTWRCGCAKSHAILAATNIEVKALNDLAQQKRLQAGKLNQLSSVTLGGETLYGGDRVLFTKKNRRLRVENGDAGTIVGVRNNPLNAAVQVRVDGEATTREIPLRTLHRTHYDGLTRGYATTVHKMQSRTVDHSYCHLVGGMTDQELTYVAFSRHRKSLHIYTDENHAGVALTNLARSDRQRTQDDRQARSPGRVFTARQTGSNISRKDVGDGSRRTTRIDNQP